jgi:hypothetical protein
MLGILQLAEKLPASQGWLRSSVTYLVAYGISIKPLLHIPLGNYDLNSKTDRSIFTSASLDLAGLYSHDRHEEIHFQDECPQHMIQSMTEVLAKILCTHTFLKIHCTEIMQVLITSFKN